MDAIFDQILSHCSYRTLLTFRLVSKAACDLIDDHLLRHVAARQNRQKNWCIGPPTSDKTLSASIAVLPQALHAVHVLDTAGIAVPRPFFTWFPHVHTIRRWSGTMGVATEYPPIIPMLVDYADISLARPTPIVLIPQGVRLHVLHVKFPHTNWETAETGVYVGGESAQGEMVLVVWPSGIPPSPPSAEQMKTTRLEVAVSYLSLAARQHAKGSRYTFVGLERVHPGLLGQNKTPTVVPQQLFDVIKHTIRMIYRIHIKDDRMVDNLMTRTRLLTHNQWAHEMGNVIGTEWEDDIVFNDWLRKSQEVGRGCQARRGR
ncbi:uncharacterized protein LOC62_03G003556 [Vanrija pseudolonga]|uniref:F-box domain-containing protein n=1 Tax=Vanrija pseudolonga TaxID=143232 RepID=A0AAF0Y4B3_9TREE|nr:hypothetical protein LOC62_03G003556 [Vanrija pseudolonga]